MSQYRLRKPVPTPGRDTPTTAPVNLGSLVTTPPSERGTCARCESQRVTAITMTLTDGSEVDFVSCHACEHRTWAQEGSTLDLPSVLSKAQKHKTG